MQRRRAGRLSPGLRDAAQPRVVAQDEITRVQGQMLKRGIIAGKKQPVGYLAAQQLDAPDRGKFPTQAFVRRIDTFCKDQPDAIVLRRFEAISEHHQKAVAAIDCKAGKHPLHFGVQGSERFQNECVWDVQPVL